MKTKILLTFSFLFLANGIVWGQNNKETLAKNYYEKAQGSLKAEV